MDTMKFEGILWSHEFRNSEMCSSTSKGTYPYDLQINCLMAAKPANRLRTFVFLYRQIENITNLPLDPFIHILYDPQSKNIASWQGSLPVLRETRGAIKYFTGFGSYLEIRQQGKIED